MRSVLLNIRSKTVTRIRTLAGSGMLAVMLTGCMVGPDYVRPTIDVGTQFKETPGWKVARPAANDPRGPWWSMYRDPVLSELIQELNLSNQNIAQAEARFRQAVAVTQGARAPLLPSVSATANTTRSGGGVSAGTSAAMTGYGLNAQANWQLDIWGSIRRNIESTDATELALAADVAGARLTARDGLDACLFAGARTG